VRKEEKKKGKESKRKERERKTEGNNRSDWR